MIQAAVKGSDGIIFNMLALDEVRRFAGLVEEAVSALEPDRRPLDIASYIPTLHTSDIEKGYDRARRHIARYLMSPYVRRRLRTADSPSYVEVVDRFEAHIEGSVSYESLRQCLPDEIVDAFAVIGDDDLIRERYRRYSESGVSMPVVHVADPHESIVAELERILSALG